MAAGATETFAEIREVGTRHDAELVEPLTSDERDRLVDLLGRLPAAQGVLFGP